jgi:hypothetical protein
MTMKNFFLFSLSIVLLMLSGIGGFYLWRQIKVAADERYLQQTLLEKRKKDDELFTSEFIGIYKTYLKSVKRMVQDIQLNNSLTDLENKMVQDGYTHAEVGAINNCACDLLKEEINEGKFTFPKKDNE